MKKISVLLIIVSLVLFGCKESEEHKFVCDLGNQQISVSYNDKQEVSKIHIVSTKQLSKELMGHYSKEELLDELELLFKRPLMQGVKSEVTYNEESGVVFVEIWLIMDELDESTRKRMHLDDSNHLEKMKELLNEHIRYSADGEKIKCEDV